ncbi:40S ribosomal protein S15-4 [Prunus dulcis]|uniref:40S ribosomal protein S15-4 n=1 Tax=Prunus dulcis TaxID=3755 RepID=A0A4Y1S1Q0_PRUDU|nr:40S ribosomal protein S15-4 [Prunus dulcis]
MKDFFNGRDRGLHCFSDSFYFHKNPRPTDNSRQRVRVLLHYFQRISDGRSGNRCGSRAAELAEGRFQRGSNQKPMALIKKLRKGRSKRHNLVRSQRASLDSPAQHDHCTGDDL